MTSEIQVAYNLEQSLNQIPYSSHAAQRNHPQEFSQIDNLS